MTHEIRVISSQGVKNKCLVRFRNVSICEAFLVRQVHFCRDSTCVQAGRLRVAFEVYRFGRLDTDDKFVPSNILEDSLRHIFELNTYFDLGFVESLFRYCQQNAIAKNDLGCPPLPAFRMKGTPSHLGLLIQRVQTAKVGLEEFGGTVLSSK